MTMKALRPDDDTLLGMLMTTVKRLTDGQTRLASDVAKIKVAVDAFPTMLHEYTAETKRYHRSIEARLDEELGSDYDDISGSHDVKSLRDAGRNWRKRAREEENAKLKEAAAREIEAAEKAKLMNRGKALAPLLVGIGIGIWQVVHMAWVAAGK